MDASNLPEIETFLRLLGRLHPAATHFPIALLMVGAGAEALAALSRKRRHSQLSLICLIIGGVGAGVAAWFGWLLADYDPPGSSAESVLFWHRWVGIGVAGLAAIALAMRLVDRFKPKSVVLHVYRGVYLLAAMLVGIVGYLGGEMVFGSNHILEVLADPDEPDPALAEAPVTSEPEVIVNEAAAELFTLQIQPALENSCYHCHGPRKQKGALRLDRPADVSTVVVAGDVDASVLFERISLPFDHPDLMPPDDDRLPENVVQAFRQWIEGGAPWVEPKPVTLDFTDEAPAVEPVEPAPEVMTSTEDALLQAIDAELEALKGHGIRAVRLEASSEVSANLSLLAENATNETLELLEPLGEHLVRLDLGGTAITDDGIIGLTRFPNLRRLKVERTAVTDSGLRALLRLHVLEHLDCSETAVTDASIDVIASLSKLQYVNLWKTSVTEGAVELLRATRPNLEVVTEP